MKFKTILFFISLLLFSCNKEERISDGGRSQKHDNEVVEVLTKNWKYPAPFVNPKVQGHLEGWNEWKAFNRELQQHPKGPLSSFRAKSRNLTLKGQALENNIPSLFSKPAIKSRISTLNTKLKSLETYMTLRYIPTDKVLKLIPEIASELAGVQNQMNEIIVKSEIPKEEGETIMLQALDTTRNARREIQEPKP